MEKYTVKTYDKNNNRTSVFTVYSTSQFLAEAKARKFAINSGEPCNRIVVYLESGSEP